MRDLDLFLTSDSLGGATHAWSGSSRVACYTVDPCCLNTPRSRWRSSSSSLRDWTLNFLRQTTARTAPSSHAPFSSQCSCWRRRRLCHHRRSPRPMSTRPAECLLTDSGSGRRGRQQRRSAGSWRTLRSRRQCWACTCPTGARSMVQQHWDQDVARATWRQQYAVYSDTGQDDRYWRWRSSMSSCYWAAGIVLGRRKAPSGQAAARQQVRHRVEPSDTEPSYCNRVGLWDLETRLSHRRTRNMRTVRVTRDEQWLQLRTMILSVT